MPTFDPSVNLSTKTVDLPLAGGANGEQGLSVEAGSVVCKDVCSGTTDLTDH